MKKNSNIDNIYDLHNNSLKNRIISSKSPIHSYIQITCSLRNDYMFPIYTFTHYMHHFTRLTTINIYLPITCTFNPICGPLQDHITHLLAPYSLFTSPLLFFFHCPLFLLFFSFRTLLFILILPILSLPFLFLLLFPSHEIMVDELCNIPKLGLFN